jgi:hypothetical protein
MSEEQMELIRQTKLEKEANKWLEEVRDVVRNGCVVQCHIPGIEGPLPIIIPVGVLSTVHYQRQNEIRIYVPMDVPINDQQIKLRVEDAEYLG